MGNQPANVNVNVNVGPGYSGPVQVRRQTGCLMQVIYFLFIGWWLGALAVSLAYFLFALVITIPLGVAIINRIPYLMALREPPQLLTPWGVVQVQQHPMLLRAIWFLLVGLWLALFWMSLAYMLCLTIIVVPIGFWMFDKTPALLTLHREA